MATVDWQELEGLVAAALERNATSPANARTVAQALVLAEADGLKGHGLSRVPSYAAQARAGKVDGRATPSVARPAGAVVAIDAAGGFAYPALDAAVATLPEVAPTQGVAVAAIRRSHHCGAAGLACERLADEGLMAMLFANTPPAIAPWGGRKALFGTNPIAFACPLPDAPPMVIDLSLSKVARGNILAAKQRGEAIPEGWAFDDDGQPTTDPTAALGGTMAPAGDAKGTALALMVELLAAGLTGANYAEEASSFLDAEGPPPGTGQLLLAFAPDRVGGPGRLARFAALAQAVDGEPGARLPGARRHALRRVARADGLLVADDALAKLRGL